MGDISNYLNQIKTAVKGEDVRGAIHDAIEQCYTDGNWNSTTGMVDKMARDKISAIYDTSTGNVQESVLFDGTTNPLYCPMSISDFPADPSTFDYIYVYYKPVATAEPEIRIYPVHMLQQNEYKIVVTGIYPYDPGTNNANKLLRVRRLNIRPINVSNLLKWECYSAVVWEWDGNASASASSYNVDGASIYGQNSYPAGQIVKITGVKYQSISTAVESYMSTHQFPSSGSGLTDDIKNALLNLAQQVMYINGSGSSVYSQLETALNSSSEGSSDTDPTPSASVNSITAVYNQTGTVYDTDSLNSLRSNLVVAAYYSDNTSATVTGYTLSGTLTAGTSTITVTYSGKTTTFTVTVTATSTGDTDGAGWTSGQPYSTLQLVNNSYWAVYNTLDYSDSWCRTKYVDCAGASTIEFPSLAMEGSYVPKYNAFFDSSKQHISNFTLSKTVSTTITVPSGAAYFIVSGSADAMQTFVSSGAIIPRT